MLLITAGYWVLKEKKENKMVNQYIGGKEIMKRAAKQKAAKSGKKAPAKAAKKKK